MKNLTTVESKKAVEPKIVNGEILTSTKKQGNFDLVTAGVCPHDGAKLGDEIRTTGVGVKRICEPCGHTWYINKKIKTCGCLTCKGPKRRSTERVGTSRVGQSSNKKHGGPFWARTRDLSLIRTAL